MNFFERNLRDWSLVAAALILGVSLVTGTIIVSRMVTYVKTFNTSLLSVTGTAQQEVTSDEVKWTGQFSVQTNLSSLKDGYAQMDSEKAQVLAFLQANGVSPQDVTVSPVSMSETFPGLKYNPQAAQSFGKDALSDYTLSQTVVVQSSHVHKITALAQQTNTLVNQGIVFSTQDLEYYYNELSGLRSKLIAAAVKDARARATSIAAASDVKLGTLVSVNTGVLQLTPVNSTEVSNMGTYDTTTIEKQLTAVVRASFRLDK